MPSTLTGVGASATQSTSPTVSAPADGDSLAAAGIQTPLQTLLHHIAKLWAGAFAALGSNPALQATGSATRAPLNLVPQAAPSTPSDGDVWVETTSNQVKARVAGATQILSPTATTPVAITPTAGWTAAGGLAYWRDSSGFVNVKGSVAPGGSNPVFTFPAGFRPLGGTRGFLGVASTSGTVTADQSVFRIFVGIDGTVSLSTILGASLPPTTNVTGNYLDVIRFLAEQ